MAVGDAYVFPGFLTPALTQLSFQSHRRLFSHAPAEVRGENTPERKVASTGDRTHNHQVMTPTRSPLSHQSLERILAKPGIEPVTFCSQVLSYGAWLHYPEGGKKKRERSHVFVFY